MGSPFHVVRIRVLTGVAGVSSVSIQEGQIISNPQTDRECLIATSPIDGVVRIDVPQIKLHTNRG